jgi:virginiamycin B lyase
MRRVVTALLCLWSGQLALAQTARGVFREHPVAASGEIGAIAYGDYELWLTVGTNAIGHLRLTDGSYEEIPIPGPNAGLAGIAYSSMSGVWFTQMSTNTIGRIDTQGVVHQYSVPTPASQPYGIVASPYDGSAWFTELASSRIGRIDVDGTVTEVATPTPGSGPAGIAMSPDGFGACFAESIANRIGCVSTSPTLAVHEFAIPTPGSEPRGVALGPDGAVWFTEYEGNKIGRLVGNEIVEYPLPDVGSGPWAITASYSTSEPIWFTERRSSRVGFITSEGRITNYGFPGSADPLGIVADSEKAWFTAGDSLATMRPDALVLSGAGRVGSWQTSLAFGNPTERTALFYAGLGFSPPGVCPSVGCFNWMVLQLPANGSADAGPDSGPFSGGPFTYFAREIGSGGVPALAARVENAARTSQSADLPVQRLSEITAANPAVLAFPSASSGPGVHSNLTLANLGDGAAVEGIVEAFRPDGTLLGSQAFSIFRFDWLVLTDALARLGAGSVDNAQIRVTRTSGDLFWGTLAVVRDDEGTLSMTSGSNLTGTDDAVLIGGAGVAGSWDTIVDLANPQDRAAAGDVFGRGPLPDRLCPPECPSPSYAIPANGTVRLLASDLLSPWSGHLLATTGPAVVHARVVNRASSVQAADLPTVPLSRLRDSNPDVLVFPSARRGADVRTNLFLVGIGEGDPVHARVDVLSSDGEVLAHEELDVLSWNDPGSTFVVDVLGQLGLAGLGSGQVRVTRMSGGQLLWGVLSNVYADGRLSVVAPLLP